MVESEIIIEEETKQTIVKASQSQPLRELVAKYMADEAKNLSEPTSQKKYQEVSTLIIEAGQKATTNPDAQTSLEIDATGLDWLDCHIPDRCFVLNLSLQKIEAYDPQTDPEVISFTQAIERYVELYDIFLSAGARSDEQKNSRERLAIRLKRDFNNGVNGKFFTTHVNLLACDDIINMC